MRYRGSALGVYWSLLNPVLMTTVYAAIFGTNFAPYYGSLEQYVVALFIGLIVVSFFVAATQSALISIVVHGALLNKVRVPVESFPISAIAAQSFQLFVAPLPVLAILTFVVSQRPWHIVLLPVALAELVLMSAGVGFVVSALYVHFRDLSYLYDFVALLVWITTPVFYPVVIVPQNLRNFLYFNPLYTVLAGLRGVVEGKAPPFTTLTFGLAEAVVICAAGYLFFRLTRKTFMDLL